MATDAAEKADQTPPVIGLALSGGGFRATAFHLGVLQRLRELGLLQKIALVSTVSGGSIAGASWLSWHVNRGDTFSDSKAWERYASSLIWIMSIRNGIRGFVFILTFLIPASCLGVLAGILLFLSRPASGTLVSGAVLMVLALSYLCWHYLATTVLVECYSRWLMGDATLDELDPADTERACPILLINATGLNSGEHLVFPTHQPPTTYDALLPALMLRTTPRYALKRGMPPINMPGKTRVAQAVAASSAIPGAFAPLRFTHVLSDVVGFLRTPIWGRSARRGVYLATDGGVYDNQGTRLLASLCQHLIVSDGAAALREQITPSTWQLWPPGQGVLFRAQEISYNRARELGYESLEDRTSSYRNMVDALRECGVPPDKVRDEIDKRGPFLHSYSYVELEPSEKFGWTHGDQRLPDKLVPLVARVRTDLDSFSMAELSALMFHGYTMIDHCLRAYQRELLPEAPPPLKFQFPFGGIFKDWDHPTDEEIERAIAHLRVSGSRLSTWRRFYRWRNKC